MTLRSLGLAGLLALAACGGGKPADEGPPPDNRLEQANRAGTRALSLNQTEQAIKQYRAALAVAYERDDAAAIGDVGYNLAVAQLRSGATAEAARTAREVRAELDRRRQAPPAELVLVQAAAAYRLGAADQAMAFAQEVLARAPLPPEISTRAWYIRGTVAADQRRLALDYRGMARALSFAGDATLRQGRTEEAAVLFLRAGRSALLQGDAATGRGLLDRADSLAKQSGAAGVSAEVDRVRKAAAASKS